MQAKRFPLLDIPELVQQIKARQKAKVKLTTWAENDDIIFPKMLSLEQSSSETTAKFKASLVSGDTLIDLTGGMGIDVAYMSKSLKNVFHAELNTTLSAITQHNFKVLAIENVHFIQGDSVEWLRNNDNKFSWIYLDPHRRDDSGSKVVRLEDCEPNIVAIQDELWAKTDNILLKASPMLAIDLAILTLKNVVKVYTVAVENEVKEILFHLQKHNIEEPEMIAINFLKNNLPEYHTFSFHKSAEKNAVIHFSPPQQFLYEPNAAILKSGGFRIIAQQFGLHKIAPHSHLYTSTLMVDDFQGRIFEIVAVCKLDKKEILPLLSEAKANITIRNFPLTVTQIREKLKLPEGGKEYLFATTDAKNQKIVIVCRKPS